MRGDHFAYKQNFMDLDPIYTDKWGDTLLRMTLDWTDYEMRQMAFGEARNDLTLEDFIQEFAVGPMTEGPLAFCGIRTG